MAFEVAEVVAGGGVPLDDGVVLAAAVEVVAVGREAHRVDIAGMTFELLHVDCRCANQVSAANKYLRAALRSCIGKKRLTTKVDCSLPGSMAARPVVFGWAGKVR